MKKCPKCGQLLEDNQLFCSQCGTRVIVKKRCASCGAELEDDLNFCPLCGQKIQKIRYCTQCGTKAEGDMAYCSSCGAKLDEKPSTPFPMVSRPSGTVHAERVAAWPEPVSPKVPQSSLFAKIHKMENIREKLRHGVRQSMEGFLKKIRKNKLDLKKLRIPLIAAAAVAVLVIVFCSVLKSSGSHMETPNMKVEAVCVDESYRGEDESLRPLYLYYTLTATDEDLKIDSKYMTLTLDDGSEYESQVLTHINKCQEKYYYSGNIENVYFGENRAVSATFMVPVARLEQAKSFTLTDDQIPGVEKIRVKLKDIQYLDGDEAVCKAVDPDGYEHNMYLREDADEELRTAVQSNLTGRYWIVSIGNGAGSCTITFVSESDFTMELLGRTNEGTYSVRNGYLYCTYDGGTTYPLQIPYTIDENGKVSLTFSDVI